VYATNLKLRTTNLKKTLDPTSLLHAILHKYYYNFSAKELE